MVDGDLTLLFFFLFLLIIKVSSFVISCYRSSDHIESKTHNNRDKYF